MDRAGAQRGGSHPKPDGTSAKRPTDGLLKGQADLDFRVQRNARFGREATKSLCMESGGFRTSSPRRWSVSRWLTAVPPGDSSPAPAVPCRLEQGSLHPGVRCISASPQHPASEKFGSSTWPVQSVRPLSGRRTTHHVGANVDYFHRPSDPSDPSGHRRGRRASECHRSPAGCVHPRPRRRPRRRPPGELLRRQARRTDPDHYREVIGGLDRKPAVIRRYGFIKRFV